MTPSVPVSEVEEGALELASNPETEAWGEDKDGIDDKNDGDKDDIEKDAMIKAKVKKPRIAASKKGEAGGSKNKGKVAKKRKEKGK